MKVVEDAKKITAVERAQGAKEKHGAFTGRYVVNPINGEKVPVWVADYIVADYGTGAVMAVPCGDQRDVEFAKKYDLPIIPIIVTEDDPLYEQLKDEQGRQVTSVEWEEAMAAEGIRVHTFTDEELSAFAESCRTNVWPQLAKNYPDGWLDQVKESVA